MYATECRERRFRICQIVILVAMIATLGFLLAGGLAGCSFRNSQESVRNAGDAGSGANGVTSSSTTDLTVELYGNLNDFTAATLDGGAFNSSDFAGYDITMVNVWTTHCPFCIKEMPGIELLYQRLPANVNLITICMDGDASAGLAQSILKKSGTTFPVLLNSDSLKACFTGNVSGVPTTVYVDCKGNIVGYPQVGAPTVGDDESVAERYMEQIQDCLAQVG